MPLLSGWFVTKCVTLWLIVNDSIADLVYLSRPQRITKSEGSAVLVSLFCGLKNTRRES